MAKGVPGFLVAIVFLTAVVVIALFLESGKKQQSMQETQEYFQAALGGIGTGAVVTPSWNFGDYDVRLQPGGYDRSYPVPGGYSYSPDRLTMVSGFQSR